MSDPRLSRGYKNKNPTNLDYLPPSRAWNGQDRMGDEWLPISKRRFGHYTSHVMGIRGGTGQLVVNQTRKGFNTIKLQISSWAPYSDGNDTAAYCDHVAKSLNIGINSIIDCRKYSIMVPLIKGIISMECGGMPYSDAEIFGGLELYGITPASEH